MKQTATLWSLLLTLIMTVTVSTAQESDLTRLQITNAGISLRTGESLAGFGYAGRNVDAVRYLRVGKVNVYLSAYILLLDVGASKIERISFPTAVDDQPIYLLILSGDGKRTLYNQPYRIVAGTNQIALTTPFAAEAGKRYPADFATKAIGNDEDRPELIPSDGVNETKGAQYAGYGTKPYPTNSSTEDEFRMTSVQDCSSAFIFVKLQDESKLQSVGYSLRADGDFKLVKAEGKVPTKVTFYNFGVKDVISFEASYRFGTGEPKFFKRTPKEPLQPPQDIATTIAIPAKDKGMGTLHVALAKANDQEDIFTSSSSQIPHQIGSSAAINQETVLLERFSTEQYPKCPLADPYVKDNVERLQTAGLRVSCIVYHSSYLTDFLTTKESEVLYIYFFDESSFAPAMSINRTFLPSWNALVGSASAYPSSEWIPRVKKDKQGVRIEWVDQRIDDSKLTAVVSGVALKDSFDPEDLYLTVIVTEGNVPSRAQAGTRKNYKHSAMSRLFLTAPTGDKLQPQSGGTFPAALEGALMPTWVGSQYEVVAIVHPSVQQSNHRNRAVHIAETAQLGFPLADEPVAPAQAPIVTVKDGYLSVRGRVDVSELHDMSDTLVTISVEIHLLPGTYIIHTLSDLCVYASKVVIR